MSELPEIGSVVHATVDDSVACLPLYVHGHMTPTHLELADVPPSTDPAAPQRAQTVFAVTSDDREPGTWHPVCD